MEKVGQRIQNKYMRNMDINELSESFAGLRMHVK